MLSLYCIDGYYYELVFPAKLEESAFAVFPDRVLDQRELDILRSTRDCRVFESKCTVDYDPIEPIRKPQVAPGTTEVCACVPCVSESGDKCVGKGEKRQMITAYYLPDEDQHKKMLMEMANVLSPYYSRDLSPAELCEKYARIVRQWKVCARADNKDCCVWRQSDRSHMHRSMPVPKQIEWLPYGSLAAPVSSAASVQTMKMEISDE